MKYQPIKNDSSLGRTPEGAVVNIDKSAYKKAKRAKQLREEQAETINNLVKEVDELKTLIKTLKDKE